ncbi:class F sortase [Candidatus Saccharibacteria bacterium]|nr:MAG: class F sortase [Candidatus Saccharibacteria bacterium]
MSQGKEGHRSRKQPGFNSLVFASAVGFIGGWSLVERLRSGESGRSKSAIPSSKLSAVISSKKEQRYTWVINSLIVGGLALLALGIVQQQSAPSVTFQDKGTINTSGPITKAPSVALPFSPPVSLSIPAADVSSDMLHVGKDQDGQIEVPSGDFYNFAAWYKSSPTPGQAGASVIIGHVDSIDGASVFYKIEQLNPGDEIYVQREDGRQAVFTVDAVKQYEQDNFPAETVYLSNENRAELRLITCGGAFSETEGKYQKNTVVFATLKETS